MKHKLWLSLRAVIHHFSNMNIMCKIFIFLPPRRVEFGLIDSVYAVEMTHDGSLPIPCNQLID